MWRCTKPKTSLNGRESQVILDIVHCVTLIWNGEMYFPVITISVRLVLMLMYEWVSICTRVLNVHGWLISPCLCSVKSALSPSFFFFSFFFPFFFGWTLFRFFLSDDRKNVTYECKKKKRSLEKHEMKTCLVHYFVYMWLCAFERSVVCGPVLNTYKLVVSLSTSFQPERSQVQPFSQ